MTTSFQRSRIIIKASASFVLVSCALSCQKKQDPAPTPTPATLCAKLVEQKLVESCEEKSADAFKEVPVKALTKFEVKFAGETAFLGEYVSFEKEEQLEKHMELTTSLQKDLALDLYKQPLPESGYPRFYKNRKLLLLAVVIPGGKAEQTRDKERSVARLVQEP